MNAKLQTARDVTDSALAACKRAAALLTEAEARLDDRPIWREMMEKAARDLDRALAAEREARKGAE